MPKKILKQDDIDNNPVFVEWGLIAGDEIEIPEDSVSSSETTNNEENNDGGIEVPKKPPPP